MSNNHRSLAFVVNDAASQCPDLNAALKELRNQGHGVEVFSIANAGQAVRSNCHAVIAAGGDGTLNRVVSAVFRGAGQAPAIGVVPYGTGNDFATACGVSTNLTEALQLIVQGEARPIDVGITKDRHFINVVSGGFGAEVTAGTSAELKAMLGKLAYTVAGLGKIFEGDDRQAVIRGQDFNWQGSLLFLSIANGRRAGGGYHVAPQAVLDDGLLDVLVVPDAGLLDAPSVLLELFGLGAVNTEIVQYVRIPWVEVETAKGIQLSIDGEPYETKSFRAEIMERRLPFLLPNQAPLQQTDPH